MNQTEFVFLTIAVTIAVFLLLREVFCWYFKINKRVALQEKVLDELVKLNSLNSDLSTISSEAASILRGR